MFVLPTTMTVAFVALALERFLGYPSVLKKLTGHPINGLYNLNGVFSALVPEITEPPFRRMLKGAMFCLLAVGVSLALAVVVTSTLRTAPYAWFWEALIAVPFLAQYALRVRARSVANALSKGLPEAREALRDLVSHDLSELDESGVIRGCLEAMAKNLVTSIITPAFWLALFGLPGIITIIALSCVHRRLGHDRKARTLCDLLETAANYIPARLTGLLIAGAASMTSPAAGARALEVIWHDARRMADLTTGWAECAMAGALDVRLGGPRMLSGRVIERQWAGDGIEHLTEAELRAGLRLLATTLSLFTLLMGIAAAFA